MKDLSFRKLIFSVLVGGFLLTAFANYTARALDLLFLRWEYIFPPLVGVYYLSIQPYLNYADAKTYFISGAKFGTVLAFLLLLINFVYELIVYGQISAGNGFAYSLLAYTIFVVSYAVLAGIGHYIFNRNVDPKKPDVFKARYYGQALLVGGATFVVCALIAQARDLDLTPSYYYLLVPVVMAAYINVKLHRVPDKDFLTGLTLGGISGFLLACLATVLLGVSTSLSLAANPKAFPELATDPNAAANLVLIFPILLVIFTVVGAITGGVMKAAKTVL
jgi:hypothetical protein